MVRSHCASLSVLVLALCTAACGSKPGSFNGTVGGKKVEVNSSVFAISSAPAEEGEAGSQALVLLLGSPKDLCADLKTGKLAKDNSYLIIGTVKLDNTAPGPGAYAIFGADSGAAPAANTVGLGFAQVLNLNASCANDLTTEQAMATSGNINLASIDAKAGGTAKGDYSLKMGAQADPVNGSFEATFCAELGGVSASVGATGDASAVPCQ